MMAQGTGMVVSFLANRSLVAEVQEQIRPAQNQQLSPAERLQALLNLQKSWPAFSTGRSTGRHGTCGPV